MDKKSKVIIGVLSIIIICLVVALFCLNNYYIKQIDYILYTGADEEYLKEYNCSFTKTYLVKNLWTIDTKEEISGMSYVMLSQFQVDDMITAIIPTEVRDKLQEGKTYEFTYTLNGKSKTIKTMEDINTYFSSTNNDDFKIIVDVKETDKLGLEQIQDSICLPK